MSDTIFSKIRRAQIKDKVFIHLIIQGQKREWSKILSLTSSLSTPLKKDCITAALDCSLAQQGLPPANSSRNSEERGGAMEEVIDELFLVSPSKISSTGQTRT